MMKTLPRNEILGILCAVVVASGCNPVIAQSSSQAMRATSAANELLLDGDDVVVTATRTAQRLSDSPAAVTVITEADITASGATTIPDLLRSVPGVDVMEPNQSQQNVAIRGFNQGFSNTVLVMVDGRRINEDIQDSVFWNTDPILMSRIKRIEVVRGPASVLYGADAFSGVINIILKTPLELAAEAKAAKFIVSGEAHTSVFDEGLYTVSKKNDWAMTFGAGYHGLSGPTEGKPDTVQDSSSVPIFTFDLQKQVPQGSLSFSLKNADSKSDLGSTIFEKDEEIRTSYAALEYDEDRGTNPIMARFYASNFSFQSSPTFGHAQSGEFDIQQQRQITFQNSLTYGATYRGNNDQSSDTGAKAYTDHVSSLFIQDQNQIGARTTLFAGVRDDNHSVYGSQVSSRVSLVNHLSSNQSLRLSYGTAFSAPTFIDEHLDLTTPEGPDFSVKYVANQNLEPQKISSSEAGYRLDFPAGYAGLNIFYNTISDIIEPEVVQYAPPPFPAGVPSAFQFENKGSAHASGLELESGFPLGSGWSCLANLSYQDIRDEDGQKLQYSPDEKVNLILQSDRRRRFTSYLVGHYVSGSTSNSQYLRAYTTVDARVAYRLGRSQSAWTAALSSTNLLDDHHREFLDYNNVVTETPSSETAQRSIRVSLSGQF